MFSHAIICETISERMETTMKTTVIGYPRIGSLRELKFASEAYFRNEITAQELQETGRQLRKAHWLAQKNAGIDLIPCNDFSFYDIFLDTAVLCNLIPKRYDELQLSSLDTYFAMARGYQGEHGDVKALAMKKWFHTNYHYMVAEIEDDVIPSLHADKLIAECKEAIALGIDAKPIITGPFTLLKLARFTGRKTARDISQAIVSVYIELLQLLQELDINWIQFDEPYLVHDLSKEDILFLQEIYSEVLSAKGSIKVLLQTYFGDIRDCYSEVIHLPSRVKRLPRRRGLRPARAIA